MIDRPRASYDVEWVIKWHRVRALIALAGGDLSVAREAADAAVRAGRATEYLAYTAEALADRATVLEAAGQGAEARADLEAAAGLYHRKGHRVGYARIQERLAG